MKKYKIEVLYKDYVCEMFVKSEDISLDFEDIHYVFCSEQCRERFQLNPRLYIGFPRNKSPKQQGKVVIKTRKLKLDVAIHKKLEVKVSETLNAMMGVDSVDVDGDIISITYDLLQVTEVQIENELARLKVKLGDSLSERIRRAFIHFSEEVEIEGREVKPRSHYPDS